MRSPLSSAFRFTASIARRSAVGFALGAIVIALPLPEDIDPQWLMLQAPVGALLIVCSLGKALYDTLFYDHYRP